jgi:hypothetical protein
VLDVVTLHVLLRPPDLTRIGRALGLPLRFPHRLDAAVAGDPADATLQASDELVQLPVRSVVIGSRCGHHPSLPAGRRPYSAGGLGAAIGQRRRSSAPKPTTAATHTPTATMINASDTTLPVIVLPPLARVPGRTSSASN